MNGTKSNSGYDFLHLKQPSHLHIVVSLKSDPGPEDSAITTLRRNYFAELKPSDISRFEQASLPQQKKMYQEAIGEHQAALTDLTNAERSATQAKGMARARVAGILREFAAGVPGMDRAINRMTSFDENKTMAD